MASRKFKEKRIFSQDLPSYVSMDDVLPEGEDCEADSKAAQGEKSA